MDEATARRLLLVRAHDEAPGPLWSAEDAAWATRLAGQTLPADAAPARFLAERARHALERLLPRDRDGARWLARGDGRGAMAAALALLGGLLLGLGTDLVGRQAHVDVLAPAVWAVVGWNVLIYTLLLPQAWRPAGGGGWLRRALAAWRPFGSPGPGPAAQAAREWAVVSAPRRLQQAAALLHLAAAAVATGLVAGMYLRGMVFDFRAGWQSTFLDAETVQRTLALLLTPAFLATGITVPDVAGIEALRLTPAAPQAGASAAPWIHLYAATLALAVIGPRLLLAALALARAAWQSRRIALPLDDAYFQGLLRRRPGVAVARVLVCPYPAAPAAAAALALQAHVAREFGAETPMQLAAPTPQGDEDTAAARLGAPRPGLVIVLVELGSTPEPETHGRFIAALRAAAPGVPLRLLADEADFRRRFATLPARIDERRAAWQRFADAEGLPFEARDLGAAGA